MPDNDDVNNTKTENKPVLETIPIDDETGKPEDTSSKSSEKFVPEEIPEETPEDLTLQDIGGGSSTTAPALEEASFGRANGMRKYLFLGAGIVGVLLLFIVVFTVILSITRGGGNEEVTLEYWGLWEDPEVMQPFIEEYTKEHPNVTIVYKKQDPRQYREKLVTRVSEGSGPDIFRYHNTWLPSVIQAAAPLPKSVMSDEEYKGTFYDIAQSDLFLDGSYYGIPLSIDGLVLVYNKSLFQAAGISNAPQTWDDVFNAASDLRVIDGSQNIVTAGIAIGTANNIEHYPDIFGWMLLQNGADIRNLSASEAVEVLKNYRAFAEPQLNLWNRNMPRDIDAFIQSKVGMIIVPTWEILEIQASNPDIEIGVAPLPVLPGTEQISLASYWVEGVSRKTKNQEAAWEFLKYLSSRDVQTRMYQEQTKLRLFGTPYSRIDLRETLIENEYVGPVLEQAPNMRSLPLTARTYDQALNDQIITYIGDAINATEQGVSYDQALSTAQNGVQSILEQYNIQ